MIEGMVEGVPYQISPSLAIAKNDDIFHYGIQITATATVLAHIGISLIFAF